MWSIASFSHSQRVNLKKSTCIWTCCSWRTPPVCNESPEKCSSITSLLTWEYLKWTNVNWRFSFAHMSFCNRNLSLLGRSSRQFSRDHSKSLACQLRATRPTHSIVTICSITPELKTHCWPRTKNLQVLAHLKNQEELMILSNEQKDSMTTTILPVQRCNLPEAATKTEKLSARYLKTEPQSSLANQETIMVSLVR